MHSTTTRVRFGETDLMGVVYHPNYLVYFEEGRTEFLRSVFKSYAELEAEGFRLVVVDVGLRYLAPAHYDECIDIETRLTELSRVRMRFEYRVTRRETNGETTLLTTGHTTLASLDAEGKPRRVPEDLRAALEAAKSERFDG